MNWVNHKTSMLDLSKILLFLLIISINIREPFFHSREILFVLVVLTSFFYIDVNQLKYAITLVLIWLITACYNILIPGSNYALNLTGLNTIVISAYLFLLCFSQKRYSVTIIKSYIFVSAIVAIVTTTIWLACFFSDGIYSYLRSYFIQLYNSTGLTFISIDYRAFLGTRYLTVWYRTSPCMICALGYCLIERLNEKKKYTILIILFAVALVFSGTRANMLSSFLLILLYVAFWVSKKKLSLLKIILIGFAILSAIYLADKFLNDATSASSRIKVSDVSTYFSIFESDIIRTLFFGWGPSSTFFSVGRGLTIDTSELTLFETIRRYGLISTMVIFFYIWFQPMYIILAKKNLSYKSFYLAALFAFIITACTNPYLLDSVGFCALLFFTVYYKYGINDEHIDHPTNFLVYKVEA